MTNKEFVKKDEKLQDYLIKFPKNSNPEFLIENGYLSNYEVAIGDDIVKMLKNKELTYVDAYATLEYVYNHLKFMSEYTHL